MRRSILVIAAAVAMAALVLVALPAGARASGSAYVVGSFNVSQFAIGADDRLSPLSPATLATGDGDAYGIVVAPDGKSAYVTGGSRVFQYDVDARTGALSPKAPASVPSDESTLGTAGVAITPDGKSLYATASEPHGFSHILQYDVDANTGALSLKSLPGTAELWWTGFVPGFVTVAPNGKSAYIADPFEGALQYDIDPVSGVLSFKAAVPTGGYAAFVAVAPDGRSAYFVSRCTGPRFCSPQPSPSTPTSTNDSVAQFDIDPVSGALAAKTPALVLLGPGPHAHSIAITPDGKSAFVSAGSSVWQYDIDPVSGALSLKAQPTVATDGAPADIAVTPDGKAAYVTNAADSSVWQYDIDPVSGALSPKSPPTVATGAHLPGGGGAPGIAIGPLPRTPTTKEQCKNGGWQPFGFNNQGECVAFVERGSKP